MPALSREESKRQTREALLLAGIELFAQSGLSGPSLDAICEQAGRTRGAFYVHFADRDAFNLAIMERILQSYVDIIVETADAGGDLERSVERFVEAMLGTSDDPFLGEHTQHLHLLLEGCRDSAEVQQRFVMLVEGAILRLAMVIGAGQAVQRVRSDVDAQQAATLLVAVVFGVITLQQTGVPHDVGPLAQTVLELVRPS